MMLMLMVMVVGRLLGFPMKLCLITFVFAGVKSKVSKKNLAGAGEEPATSSHLVDAGMCPAHFIFLLFDLIESLFLALKPKRRRKEYFDWRRS